MSMRRTLFLALLVAGTNVPAQEKAAVADPADMHRLLGESYVNGGMLREALREFRQSSALRGGTDAGVLKRLATVGEWVRGYTDAARWLSGALSVSPGDPEAADALRDLRLRRSLHLTASAGGNEPDYVSRAREVGAFAGWVDWLDLYGGYAVVDKPFYTRTTSWADAYVFPDYRFSIRAGVRFHRYSYPDAASAPPDRNAYRTVPEYQIEGAYHYGEHNMASLELEAFRPRFYWAPGLHALNFKATATAEHALAGGVYGLLFVSLLRDPDPDSFTLEPASTLIHSFAYEKLGLAGGALGFDRGKLSGEIRYIPDRDLDRSIRWSLFGRMRWDLGGFSVQYDLVYDAYAESASRGFSASRVNMVTLVCSPLPSLELRPGAKLLSRDVTEVVPFLSVRLRTGI